MATEASSDPTATQTIDNYIGGLTDWRGDMLAHLRAVIGAADPGLAETWKWNTPVWAKKGNVVAISAFKDHVKINFFRGSELPDPHGFFNAGLDAKAMRSVDLYEGDAVDDAALQEMVRAAVALDTAGK